MPEWIVDGWSEIGVAAAKVTLMYLLTLFALRLTHRRLLSQWTAIDMIAAVAIGAIVGRTAIAGDQSFAVGATAVLVLLLAHFLATTGKSQAWFSKAVDHRVRVLLEHGELRRDQLRACGLTESEVSSQLRQKGVDRLSDLRYVLYEPKGELTIVYDTDSAESDSEMVQAGLELAAQYRTRRER